VKDLEFPRCVNPNGAVGNSILIVFSDGSKYAYVIGRNFMYVWF
jgi:hypothetical protein